MSLPRDAPNPLRPYYIPPSIGLSPEDLPSANSSGSSSKYGSSSTYAASARDIFSDIDYADYVSDGSQSTLATIKEVLDQAMYKYMSVILAQPFDVAKTVLQVRSQAGGDSNMIWDIEGGTREQGSSYRDSIYSEVVFLW